MESPLPFFKRMHWDHEPDGFPQRFETDKDCLCIFVRPESLGRFMESPLPLFRTHGDPEPLSRSAELLFGTFLPGETETPSRTGVRRSGSWRVLIRFYARRRTMNLRSHGVPASAGLA